MTHGTEHTFGSSDDLPDSFELGYRAAYPGETFMVDDIGFHADAAFTDALRSLQDDNANLQHRVWQLEDDAS